MTQEHPITPPPELIEDWIEIAKPLPQQPPNPNKLATLAARWGANQEVEACCQWLSLKGYDLVAAKFRDARCPKPLSLKEQALATLAELEEGFDPNLEDLRLLRRALDSLPS